jgi:hypothetical protein
VLVTLLSIPVFLWLKSRVKQSLVTYLISGLFLSVLVSSVFLVSVISLGDNPIDGALFIALVIVCYGFILGFFAWVLRGQVSSSE